MASPKISGGMPVLWTSENSIICAAHISRSARVVVRGAAEIPMPSLCPRLVPSHCDEINLPTSGKWLSRAHSPSRIVALVAHSPEVRPSPFKPQIDRPLPPQCSRLHRVLHLRPPRNSIVSASLPALSHSARKTKPVGCDTRPWSNEHQTSCAMTLPSLPNSATEFPAIVLLPSQLLSS